MPLASSFTDQLTAWSTLSAAVFTAMAAGVAVFALIAGVRAYRTQARLVDLQGQQLADQQAINQKQSAVLELQADELRESIADRRRVAAEQRQAQAALVFFSVTYERAEDGIYKWSMDLSNTSRQPIYEAAVRWRPDAATQWSKAPTTGAFNPHPRIEPGDKKHWSIRLDASSTVNSTTTYVVAEFRDSAQTWWRMMPNGRIEEIASREWR